MSNPSEIRFLFHKIKFIHYLHKRTYLLLTTALFTVRLFLPPALGHEDLDAQIFSINQKLEERQNDYELFFRRGRVHLQNESTGKALVDLNYVLSHYPEQHEPFVYRGLSLHKQGHHQQALNDLNAYIHQNNSNYFAYEIRASIKKSQGDIDGAIGDYTKAISLSPKPEYFSKRAQLLYQAGSLNAAIMSYEEGLKILGESIPLILELVDFQIQAGSYGKAIYLVRVGQKYAYHKAEWKLKEAEILSVAGRFIEAQTTYQEILNIVEARVATGPVPEIVLLQKLRALVGLKRFAKARDLLYSLGPSVQKFDVYRKIKAELEKKWNANTIF